MKVTHVITGLSVGGAETALLKLLSRTSRTAFEPEVISLTTIGEVGEKIRALGVPVRSLGMRRGVPDPAGISRLVSLLGRSRPDVVQTWMYHADLIGGLSAKFAGGLPVVWNIRHSHLDPRHSKRTTVWTARACALLSGAVPERIICAAEVSRQVHAGLGYRAKKMVVIPNGFDLSVLAPDPGARASVRQEIGVSDEVPLVGLVARFHPDKDHRNFVGAAGLLRAERPDVRFLLCGEGVTPENRELHGWLEETGVRDRCHLLGARDDVPRLYAALDVAVSSSSSEGFPNVVGESMACGVPCVVTDVGDSAAIVAGTGVVVPPRDPRALARGVDAVLDGGVQGDAAALRARIVDNFGVEALLVGTESALAGVAGQG